MEDVLIKDICARLPYKPIVDYEGEQYEILGYVVGKIAIAKPFSSIIKYIDVKDCRLYLRPMSSMTEEESAELSNIINEWFDKELFYLTEEPFMEYALYKINYSINPRLFDWLNKKMFDYRGLIPKGLANSTEKFNPLK